MRPSASEAKEKEEENDPAVALFVVKLRGFDRAVREGKGRRE